MQYGYFAIFSVLALGVIGLPIPDEVLLTYLGYLTGAGIIVFLLTIIVALAGSICGITIHYAILFHLGLLLHY